MHDQASNAVSENVFFQDLADTLPCLVWSAGADGVSDYYNSRFLEYLGKTLEEMQGWSWTETLHPDDRKHSMNNWIAAFTSGTDYHVEYRIRRAADSHYLWHECRATPLRNADGQIVRWFGTCTNIEERRRAEEALHHSIEQMDLSLRAAGAGKWELDIASGRANWSPQLFNLFGLDPTTTEADYATWVKLLHPDDRDAAVATIQKIFRDGGKMHYEYRIIRPDDQLRWMKVLSQSFGTDGREERLCGITIDITERKELEERYRRFASLTSDYIHLCTRSGTEPFRVRWIDGAVDPISGFSTADIIEQGCILSMVHPDDRQAVSSFFSVLVPGDQQSIEFRIVTKDRQVRWVQERSTCEAGPTGELLLFGSVTDITERKQAQESLQLKNLVFEQSLTANSISDREGILSEVNKAFVKCWGYDSKDEVVGKPIRHFLANPSEAQKIIQALLCDGQWEGDFSAKRKDGSLFTAHGLATVVSDEAGAIIGFQSSVLDITERKKAETGLAAAKEAAETANKAKDEFLANMSHEIRTPIAGIMGMAELLEGTYLNPTQQRYLSTILSSSDTLLTLINDILDLAKVESGKFHLERRVFCLRECVNHVVRAQIPIAHSKGLALKVETPDDIPEELIGDPLRLKQILLNLIGNAIKFTPSGEVAVTVSFDNQKGDAPRLVFAISDTGIGISPDYMAHLFTPFTQADASMARKFGGTGLGLSICLRLAQIMGGEILVESHVGVGSTFRVYLPFAVNGVHQEFTCPSSGETVEVSNDPTLRILLVEDNEVSRFFLTELLHKYGHQVEIAVNGAEALELWRRGGFDLVFMDVQMPVMDGVEAVAKVREAERVEGGHVTVIALTAHAMQDDRERFLAQGFDGYVSKPIKIRDLLGEIKRCLNSPAPRSATLLGSIMSAPGAAR